MRTNNLENMKMYITDSEGNQLIQADGRDVAGYLRRKEKFKEENERAKANKILYHKYGGKINMFQYALAQAVDRLDNIELRVFIFLMSESDYYNKISISQSEIAKKLETTRTYVNKAIKGLEEKAFLNIEKKNNINYYELNPELVWKGKQAEWLDTINIGDFKKKREEKNND